jgi:hypothetical protein
MPLDVFPYRDRISAMEDVFGRDNVDIRVFERARHRQSGIVGDFLEAIGADDLEAIITPVTHNAGSSLEQALILDRINRYRPMLTEDRSKLNPRRDQFLVGRLQDIFDTKLDVSEIALSRHFEAYREEYSWLHERVPETRGLYQIPKRPHTRPGKTLRVTEAAFSHACRLLNDIAVERAHASFEAQCWQARYYIATGKIDEATSAYEAAARLQPRHPRTKAIFRRLQGLRRGRPSLLRRLRRLRRRVFSGA